MTPVSAGILYRIVEWFLTVLPVDASGRRVFDETLADWRREADAAQTSPRRVAVALQGLGAVARGLAHVFVRESTSREGVAILTRLAAWSVATVTLSIALNWNQSLTVQGARVAVGPAGVALGSFAWLVALMPLLAYVSAACVRGNAPAPPRLGPPLLIGAVMVVAMGWGLPAAGQAYRELVFAMFRPGEVLPPGLRERSLGELVGFLSTGDSARALSELHHRLYWVIAVPVMLASGMTTRCLAGWRRAAGTVLPLVIFIVPFLARIDSAYSRLSEWVALLSVVVVIRVFVRATTLERQQGHEALNHK